MCDHPFENSIAISQLLPQLISSVRPISSQADCINPTLQPSSPDRNILLFPSETAKSPRAERKPTCFLSAGQSKCEAAGCKLGRLHCCCRVAATEPAAVVFAGYEIIHISPSLRSGEIRHYFFAADYLRLPKFSLTNWCIFRENTTKFPQFVGVWFYG